MNKQNLFKWSFFPLLFLSVLLCANNLVLLSSFITSVLICWYTARFGIKYSIWGLLPLLLCNLVLDKVNIAVFLLLQSIIAYTIGVFIYKRLSFSFMLIVASLLETIILVLFTLIMCKQMNTTPANLLFGESLRHFFDFASLSGNLDPNMLLEMRQTLQIISKVLQSMLPFFYLSVSLFLVYVLFGITRFCLTKQKHEIDTMPHFYELWLPRSCSVIFVILFLVSFFVDSPILTNVITFMFMIHVVCGVSVIDFYLRKKKILGILRVSIISVLLLISSFLGGIFTSILCCIGMTDRARELRR